MIGYFFKAMRIMGVVSEWSAVALQDGKVTMTELLKLGEEVCRILGVEPEFAVDLGGEDELDTD